MSRRRAHELGRDMRSTSTQDLPRLRALARTRARRRRGGSSPTTWVRLELSPTNRPGDRTSITWTAAMASAYANARGIMLASASTTRYAQYFLTASLENRWLLTSTGTTEPGEPAAHRDTEANNRLPAA